MTKSLKILPALILFSASTFFSGLYLGRRQVSLPLLDQTIKYRVINKETQEKEADFSLFWQVWDLLHEKYIEKDLDAPELIFGAIKGMVQAVGDPYTAFLKPEQNQSMKDSLNGKYEGIGAELGMRDEGLIIVAPLEGSPAEAAGVKAGDRILKINGEETQGITIAEAVSKIRGPAGEAVVLTLGRRDVQEFFEVEIVRAQITLAAIKWEDKGDGIVYLRISRFGENTLTDWDKAITEILSLKQGIKAVILDLRSNPGGYLNVSVNLATEFLEKGTAVVSEEFREGQRVPLRTTRQGRFLKVPLVVLVNEGSASASEILAAALREQRGAVLVGKRSFGKGTVQDAQDLPGGAGIHITIAKWLTSKGEWLNEKGLEVDHEVEFTDEEATAGRDPQLQKALEVARGL